MSEAPKKIWVWDYAADQLVNEKPDSTDILYVRGDIVEEMREALAGLVEYVGKDHAGVGLADLHNKGIYALKRLERA